MKFKYNSRKKSAKVHLVNDNTNKTYCKVENGSSKVNEITSTTPKGRKLCSLCVGIYESGTSTLKKKVAQRKRQKQRKSDRADFYKSKEWAELRYEALKASSRCLCCGATNKEARLTVDHIKPAWKYPELRSEPSNLQVLCILCNRGKGGYDETDWRDDDIFFVEIPGSDRKGAKLQ